MTDVKQTSQQPLREGMKAIALMLSYPESSHDTFSKFLEEIKLWAVGLSPAADSVARAAQTLEVTPVHELQRVYVDTFDFDPHRSLFLTTYEYGDGRERGRALVQLVRLLAAGGFVPAHGELADSLPVLFEFLAVKPDGLDSSQLEQRMAAVCSCLQMRLSTNCAYYSVLTAARELLPEAEAKRVQELMAMERDSQSEDDDEEMPYPLHYEG